MFMHKNVKSFALNILPENVPHVARVFDDIMTRMPNLSLLDLRFEFSVKDIEDDVVRAVLGLPNLNRIILPRFCLTNKIAETASQLSKLQTLEYQYYWYQGRGDPADIVDFRPALNEGSFPSLFDLSMTITFRDATNFLSRPFSPPNLTIMYIDSPSIETPSSVLAFLTAIPDACPLLKALTLASYIDPTVTFTSAPEKGDCITIDTLRPLLKCPNLTAFEIEHPYPIHLEPDDVEEIASSWPGVETLVLNTQTTYIEQTNLTLRSLLPFARHCPKLRILGLFLNATTADFPAPDPDSAYQLPIFRSLRQLSMGVSLIQEEGAVALFLSQLCPLHCGVEWGVTWDMSTEDLEIFCSLQPRFQKWEKVAELLPLLTRLRIEERDRAHLLKKEVQDLRIRTEVLMDKFALSGPSVDGCIAL
ncbi:hypothetical protein H0H93_010936 [Arthromyces matolae]|nr:hypothetical protein H0H93_010936 [Arthromyces matolae]